MKTDSKEGILLVKGISRRVIVVDSPDPQIFEQAIFILRTDGGGVSSQQLVDQAVRIAKNYARCQGAPAGASAHPRGSGPPQAPPPSV